MDIERLLEKIRTILNSAKHLILLLRPLSEKEKSGLDSLSVHLRKEDSKQAHKLLKQLRISIISKRIPYSRAITDLKEHPAIDPKDKAIASVAEDLNSKIEKSIDSAIINEFRKDAYQRIQKTFAPHIVGFENVKKGVILQLFAGDQFHILLLGDPGTGKTDILRASEDIAPVSAFGLGSGTSNTGLTVTVRGNEISKGILSLADKGIALIDELNLMKKEDRAGLYNAMEKGFITYDKGGHHYRFDARCSILASANPAKDKFAGKTKKEIEKQIPFDPALLSRFHLIYIIKEADIKQFMEITDGVLDEKKHRASPDDMQFIKRYIEQSKSIDVEFIKDYNDMIKKFIAEVKEKEDHMLVDVTPRFVIGLKRLIEASARIEMRKKVEKEDVWRAMEVFTLAMKDITF
ncbi:MAG: ATP-binding protein [archaeon]